MQQTDEQRERAMALVEASPAAVGAHDKRAWLALFSRDAVVQDPVGTPPNRRGAYGFGGSGEDDDLARFYDAFIAPNDIGFAVEQDVVVGLEVARDVVIHTRTGNGLEIGVPTHLLYQLVEEEGALRIARMAAHWEAGRLTAQTLRSGPKGLATLFTSSRRMIGLQGAGGWLAYAKGTRSGIGDRGAVAVAALAQAIGRQDRAALADLFVSPDVTVELPVGHPVPAHRLVEGPARDATLVVSRIRPSGWAASCSFSFQRADTTRSGIAFFEFEPHTRKLRSARFLWEATETDNLHH